MTTCVLCVLCVCVPCMRGSYIVIFHRSPLNHCRKSHPNTHSSVRISEHGVYASPPSLVAVAFPIPGQSGACLVGASSPFINEWVYLCRAYSADTQRRQVFCRFSFVLLLYHFRCHRIYMSVWLWHHLPAKFNVLILTEELKIIIILAATDWLSELCTVHCALRDWLWEPANIASTSTSC